MNSDFYEGVKARLVTRTEPKWNPSSLSDINLNSLQYQYFSGEKEFKDVSKHVKNNDLPKKRLDLIGPTFKEYPWQFITGMVREDDVKQVIHAKSKGKTLY